MRRLGLYGGTFDPIHLGHLLVAQTAEEELHLDRLFFVPAARSPFKAEASPAPAAERVRWLRLALAGRCRWEVDTQELERGGVSYTVETLREYHRRYPQARLYYLVGGDHAALLPQWRGAPELARLATFVVVSRPGEPPATVPAPFQGEQLAGISVAISSSLVRRRLQAGLAVDYLVPPPVAEALRHAGLYPSTPPS